MPPKTQFKKEQIIDAALIIARNSGIGGITARGVAEKMGSSVGPIYSQFENIVDLQEAVSEKAMSLMDDYTRKNWSEVPFLNMGVGFVCFARDEPVLFQTFMERGHVEETNNHGLQRMREDPMLSGFPKEDLKRIFHQMSYFTYGMASLASQDALAYDSNEEIIEIMRETGRDIIFMARIKAMLRDPEKTQEELNSMWGSFDEQ